MAQPSLHQTWRGALAESGVDGRRAYTAGQRLLMPWRPMLPTAPLTLKSTEHPLRLTGASTGAFTEHHGGQAVEQALARAPDLLAAQPGCSARGWERAALGLLKAGVFLACLLACLLPELVGCSLHWS